MRDANPGHVTPGAAGICNCHKYDAEKQQWLQPSGTAARGR
ncbi:hypothetical protein APV28_4368 [Comamonas testosteroni]|nr:hypothetical protein APV28_4368 [Comamonas testosteroni]